MKIMTAEDQRGLERRELLEKLKSATHGLEEDLNESVPRLERYLALARILAEAMVCKLTALPEDDWATKFIFEIVIPQIESFSKTDEERRFMKAKMLEFFVGLALNETAWALRGQETKEPEKIYRREE